MSNKYSITNFIKTIPANSLNYPNNQMLNNGFNEWRWRLLNINNSLKAEISYYNLKNKRRLYKLNNGTWVHRYIPNDYDKYVMKAYYYYTKN